MSGSIAVQGQELLQRALNNFALDLDKAVDDAVRITAIQVNKKAIELIKEQSVGKPYRKSENVVHIASKEGEAPNSDTGRLIGSVTFSHQKGAQLALVGTNLDYGALLETDRNRPWLEPAKVSQIDNFSDNMKTAIKAQVEKAGR